MLYWFFPTMYWGFMKKAYVMHYNTLFFGICFIL